MSVEDNLNNEALDFRRCHNKILYNYEALIREGKNPMKTAYS